MKKLESISSAEETIGSTQKPIKIRLSDFNFYCCKHDVTEPKYFLLKELLASKFLEYFGIHMPDMVLVDLDEDHVRDLDEQPLHLHDLVGFKWLEDAQEVDRYTEIKKTRLRDRSVLLKILLFDIWILNCDRHSFNANLMMQRHSTMDAIMPIDHGMAFFGSDLVLFRSFFESETLEIGRNGSLLSIAAVSAAIRGTRDVKIMTNQVINEFKSSIELIKEDLDKILALVPDSWHIDCPMVKEILLDTIFSSEWYNKHIIEQFLLYLKQSSIIK